MTEREAFAVGEIVVVERRHPVAVLRTGEILAVLGDPRHPHYLVRWDDGRETLYYPPDDPALHDALSYDEGIATRRLTEPAR